MNTNWMTMINQIFEPEPTRWGFRGDPFLWADLKATFNEDLATMTSEEFNLVLDSRFNNILSTEGTQLSNDAYAIKKYPARGMSGNSISLKWWHQIGLPLLKERYAEQFCQ